MPTTYGLLEQGFYPRTLNVVRQDLQDAVRAVLGASMDVGDRSVLGQLIGIFAESIALVWESAEAVNSSQDPDKATGAALDALAVLTGTFRRPPTFSAVELLFAGTDGTIIPEATQVRTTSTEQVFETDAAVTLATTGVTVWLDAATYAIGDIVTNAGQVYYCYNGADATHPAPTFTERHAITDTWLATLAEAHWVWLGEGDAVGTVAASSIVTGAVVAVAWDIGTVVSGVGGVSGVINLLDATPGLDQMTDEELRIQRELELFGAGTSPQDAILSDILKLEDVTAARVFVNNTDATVDGMPPHSVEALVQGGTDQAIINQLFNSVAAGIATTGNTSGNATDSQGTLWPIEFSRPVEVPIYVAITLTYDADEYEGDAAVKTAIAALGDGQVVGRDAVASRISAAAFSVAGVLDVTVVNLDDAPAPASSATVAIGLRSLATYDTTNIAVTSTPGTP